MIRQQRSARIKASKKTARAVCTSIIHTIDATVPVTCTRLDVIRTVAVDVFDKLVMQVAQAGFQILLKKVSRDSTASFVKRIGIATQKCIQQI